MARTLKPVLKREPVTDAETLEALGGGPLFVQELAADDRDAYESSRVVSTYDGKGRVSNKVNLANLRARLLVKSLVEEMGTGVFARAFADTDAAALGKVPGRLLDPLFEMAQRLSGLTKEADDKLQEEAEKN